MDREFVRHILEYVTNLEKIILDFRCPEMDGTFDLPKCMERRAPTEYDEDDKMRREYSQRAWELKLVAPPTVEFIVLEP